MKLRTVARAVLTLGVWWALASAAHAQTVRLAFHDMTTTGGTIVDVPVYADSSLTGLGVTAYQLEFTYNTSVFSFVEVSEVGTVASSWGTPAAFEISPGRIRIAAAGDTALAGTGQLVVVRFAAKVLSYWAYAGFYFQSAMLNQGVPAVSTANATVVVNSPASITVYPNAATLSRGETQQFSVSGGKEPFTWGTTSPSVASISSTGLLTGLSVGTTRVVCTDSAGIVDTSGIVEVRGMRLSIPDTSRFQGQTFDLPVSTSDVSGLNIISGQLTISYSDDLWTPIGVVITGTLCASYAEPAMNAANSQISISFGGTTPLSGTGVLFYIRLKASTASSGGSYFQVQSALFNENLTATVRNGYVTVTPLVPLTVSPGGSHSILAHDSLQFTVSGGSGPYTWSVSDSSRAAVSATGMLYGIRGGQVSVSVKDALGGSGSSGVISIYDFRFSVPDTSLIPSGTVEIPLTVSHTDTGYTSVQFTVTYSPSQYIQLTGVNTTGTLCQGWMVTVSPPPYPSGVVRIAAAGTTALTNAGVLLKLVFASPDSTLRPGTTSITVSNCTFNEGSPLPWIDQGYFTVNDFPVLNIQPTALHFSELGIGVTDSAALKVRNTGTSTLNAFLSLAGSSEFSLAQTSFNLAAGDSLSLVVYYLPVDVIADTAALTFSTNDPYHPSVSITLTGIVVTTHVPSGGVPPSDFSLLPNYPNPFNPSTMLTFTVPERSAVSLRVIDLLGREVATLVREEVTTGMYRIQWNADRFPSGMYLVRFEAVSSVEPSKRYAETRKVMLVK